MWIESDMLIAVLTHLFSNGITALPLHDAVVVARSHAEAPREAMQREFTRGTGSRCDLFRSTLGPFCRPSIAAARAASVRRASIERLMAYPTARRDQASRMTAT